MTWFVLSASIGFSECTVPNVIVAPICGIDDPIRISGGTFTFLLSEK